MQSLSWLKHVSTLDVQTFGPTATAAPTIIAWRANPNEFATAQPTVGQPSTEVFDVELRDDANSIGLPHLQPAPAHRLPAAEKMFLERMAAAIVVGLRQRANAQNLRAAALAAQSANIGKSQCLATMSHEIRTPMNDVVTMLDVLLQTQMTAAQRESASIAYGSAGNLLRILNDILEFSRLEANQVQLEYAVLNPRELLQREIALHTRHAQERALQLRNQIDASVSEQLLGDATRLRQVIVNLVGNAIKFTRKGHVRIAAHYESGTLFVRVTDTGIGIPSADCARLFSRFAQADSSITRRFGGTGLGLAICSEIIKAMGGEIGADSVPGEGSVFWFTVPAAPAEVHVVDSPVRGNYAATQSTASSASLQRALRILVADDNEVNRAITRAFLQSAGHDATLVENGSEALSAHIADAFDIVLMDVQMPVMDGLTATRATRGLGPDRCNVPIIAITAHALAGDREQYLAVGMNGYVAKPIDRATLYGAIAAACANDAAQPVTPAAGDSGLAPRI